MSIPIERFQRRAQGSWGAVGPHKRGLRGVVWNIVCGGMATHGCPQSAVW